VNQSSIFHVVSSTEALEQCDLNAGRVFSIPDWFKERIGEAGVKNIHDRFLSEEVIDSED
jgi:hypothetical protein